ncbi:MAG: hypothetical protein IK137_03060 [Bacilli bacterium]|nr:hypothetical protein [Bacilli bacterium]
MIDRLSYDDILQISQELKKESDVVKELASKRDIKDLIDFASTVEGYSKFLENIVSINKDADEALKGLKEVLNK